MTGIDDIWGLLGIAPTDDAREIRRAYAARLKHTRPEEDPAGFQLLLNARNKALGSSSMAVAVGVEFGNRLEPSPEPDADVISDIPLIEDEVPETVRLLKAIPRNAYPDQVEEPWMKAIAALDHAPLGDLPLLKQALLARLSYAMAEDLGPMPNLQFLPRSALKNRYLLGPYADVLRDIERRFGLLKQDTVLFDFLDWEQGWYLLAALEIAVQGRSELRPKTVPFREVRAADAIWAAAAFRSDPEMLDHHMRSVAADKYFPSLSIVGLLFPLPVALYYRLYPFATWLATVLVGIVAGRIYCRFGGAQYYLVSVLTVPFLGYLAAFSIRGMRINALGRKVASLARSEDLPSIRRKVEAWGEPNVRGMAIGIVLVLITALSFLI